MKAEKISDFCAVIRWSQTLLNHNVSLISARRVHQICNDLIKHVYITPDQIHPAPGDSVFHPFAKLQRSNSVEVLLSCRCRMVQIYLTCL